MKQEHRQTIAGSARICANVCTVASRPRTCAVAPGEQATISESSMVVPGRRAQSAARDTMSRNNRGAHGPGSRKVARALKVWGSFGWRAIVLIFVVILPLE